MCYKAVFYVSQYCDAWSAKAGSLLVLLACLAGCDDSSNNISSDISSNSSNSDNSDNGGTQASLRTPVFVNADKVEIDAGADKEKSQPAIVMYDAASNRLSIRTQDTPLIKLLGKITFQTGIETWIDEDFDPKVSADIEQQPPEIAFKKLLVDISHVMYYGKDQQGRVLLTGVEILQTGSESGMALSVVPIYSQASVMAHRYPSSKTLNLVQQRWQQRLANMPEIQRREVEAHYQKKLEKRDRQIERRKQRKADSRQRREQRQLEREKRDEALLVNDPDLYEIRMHRRQEMQQQFLDEQRAAN